jgi:micrococcal nuclease
MRRLAFLVLLASLILLAAPVAAGTVVTSSQPVTVVRVVDGDTVQVTAGIKPFYVRIIGIDTPEEFRPGVPIECGAIKAAESLRELAPHGSTVRIQKDPTQDSVDRYGRVLGYLLKGRSTDLGRTQINRGWARIYVYNRKPFMKLPGYEAASASAKEHNRGVYKLCNGDFHSG